MFSTVHGILYNLKNCLFTGSRNAMYDIFVEKWGHIHEIK